MQAALSRRGASATTTKKTSTMTTTTTTTTTITAKTSSARPLASTTAASAGSGSPSSSNGNGGAAPRPSLLRGGRGAALAGVVAAAGLFGWLTGGDKVNKDEGGKGKGKYDDVLEAARSKPRACPPAGPPPDGAEHLALASGCFWGSELVMQRVPGVVQTRVGYTQGDDPAPTYDSVCSGYTGHTEGVLVAYDKASADLETILDEYLANFDPTTRNRQGGDRGTQYRSGVYYYTEAQREVAERKLAEADAVARAGKGVTRSGRRWEGSSVVVELKPAKDFFVAESYHQQYLSRGGRFGRAQSAEKGDKTPIRCYG